MMGHNSANLRRGVDIYSVILVILETYVPKLPAFAKLVKIQNHFVVNVLGCIFVRNQMKIMKFVMT